MRFAISFLVVWGFLSHAEPALSAVSDNINPPANSAGYGNVSCGNFNQAMVAFPDLEKSFFAWAQGYMTGVNMALVASKHDAKNLMRMSVNTQKAMLRSYCTTAPSLDFIGAVSKLMAAMPYLKQ